ncbi:MAG: hypothetical protein HQM14_14705 [SAR324 cluster bacterium]|nr:hypothetical protein [SAR324 cluster bacterium]
MRRARQTVTISLFPFLSVLLCIMGILAFMSVTFLLVSETNLPQAHPETIEFQWVGAPSHVKPVFIRCLQDELVYYDLFRNKEHHLPFRSLVAEIQFQNGSLTQYFRRMAAENLEIKQSFGTTEYYPLLLIYPDGVITAELLMILIERVEGINVGLEPILPHWKIPYQSES